MNFYQQLELLLCQDLGGRGLISAVKELPLAQVRRSLAAAKRVVVVTGFPVDCAERGVRAETDGPLGAAHIAAALSQAGVSVQVVTDAVSAVVMQAVLNQRAPEAMLTVLPTNDPAAFSARLLQTFAPTHLIAIERPGKAADGHYHNMRGEVIDRMVTDSDTLFALAKAAGAVTIAVGDGGNELGMGSYAAAVKRFVPHGETLCAALAADYTLVSGVSNWWGWGIAALLSVTEQQCLLPTDAQEAALLETAVLAGAVDGCTKCAALSVDALPLERHLALLRQLRGMIENVPARGRKGA